MNPENTFLSNYKGRKGNVGNWASWMSHVQQCFSMIIN